MLDSVILVASLRARELGYHYSHAPIADDVPFGTLLKAGEDKLFRVLGRVGARPTIVRPLTFPYRCDISVGDDVFANHNLSLAMSYTLTTWPAFWLLTPPSLL